VNGFYKFLEEILPATVHIYTRIAATHPSASILGTERMGSGTIIDDTGYILTVGYVVLGADRITVNLQSGEQVTAQLIDIDFDSGLAVLHAEVGRAGHVQLGDSGSLECGHMGLIVASTNPTERRVTEGIVTDLGPFDAYWEYMLERAIMTTAVNTGFGGGAFVTLDGVMRGVVSLNLGNLKNATMAIPLEHFHHLKDDIFLHGRVSQRIPRAWLGLYPMPSPRGLIIFGVTAEGPAARAGIKQGDILIRIDQHEVLERTEFYKRLWAHRAGENVALEVMRDGKVYNFTMTSQDRATFFG
jgi:S1-C subfamily serine protease